MSRSKRSIGAALLAPACIVGLIAATTSTVGAAPPADGTAGWSSSARFTAVPCPVPVPDQPGGPVVCGGVTVPAHRDDPSGGTVTLAVVVVPAAEPSGAPPLLVLAGGPGEKLVGPSLAALAASAGDPAAPTGFASFATTRDVILLDQRGVGLSAPALECPEVVVAVTGLTDPSQLADAAIGGYAACRERLVGAGIDLSAFDTTENAADVDAVRAALGYAQVDLFGTSYGARLALQVARDHGDGLAHLILSSAIPAERNFIADAGTSYDRALRQLDHACGSDPACDAVAPDLLTTLHDVLWRLTDEPVVVPVADPATGEVKPMPIDAYTFDAVIYQLFYLRGGPELIPSVVAAAAAGDFSLFGGAGAGTPMAAAVAAALGADDQPAAELPTSLGMQASFLCAEEAVQASPAEQDPGETYAAQVFTDVNWIIGRNLAGVCEAWDVPAAPQRVFEPITTDVPTLIVTGQFDQITPPSYAVEVAAALPYDIYVQVESAGHSPLVAAGSCGRAMIEQFISADWWAVDTSCASTPPDFTPVAAGGGSGAVPEPAPAA